MNFLSKPLGSGAGKKPAKIKYPTKRTLNLYIREKDNNSLTRVIPAALFVVALVLVISKFAVSDRLAAVDRARAELEDYRSQLTEIKSQLGDYQSITEDYHRYTKNYLTDSEKYAVDRIALLDMLEEESAGLAYISSISIGGDTINLAVRAQTLSDIAAFKLRLQGSEYVSSVTVHGADNSASKREDEQSVQASIVLTVMLPLEDWE